MAGLEVSRDVGGLGEESVKGLPQEVQEKILLKEVEFSEILSQKNMEITELKERHEKILADNNMEWKSQLEVARNRNAREENPDGANADVVERLNLDRAEEPCSSEASMELLEALVKSLTMAIKEKNEALEGKSNALERLTIECKQHLDVMESCKKPYVDQITELKSVVAVQESLIEKLSQALGEAREEDKRTLEEEQHGRDLLCQRENGDKMRGLQNEIDSQQSDCNALRMMCSESSQRINEMAEQLCSETPNVLFSQKQDFGSECEQQEGNLSELGSVENPAPVGVCSEFKHGTPSDGGLEEKRTEKEVIHRDMKQMLDQGEAGCEKELDSDVGSSCGQGEQDIGLLLSAEKEQPLQILCQRVRVELNKQKSAKTDLEERLCSLQEKLEEDEDLQKALDSSKEEGERLKRELSSTRDESSKLSELVNGLSDDLHRREQELSELQSDANSMQQECRLELEKAQERCDAALGNWTSSQLKAASLEDQLWGCWQQHKESERILEDLKKERDTLQEQANAAMIAAARSKQREIETLGQHHEEEVLLLRDSLTEQISRLQADLSSADAVIQKLKCALGSASNDSHQLSLEKDQLRAEHHNVISKLKLDYDGACAEARDLRLKHDHAMMESSEKYEQVLAEVIELERRRDIAAVESGGLRVELGRAAEEVTKIQMEYDRVATEHAQQLEQVQLSLAQTQRERTQQQEALQMELKDARGKVSFKQEENSRLLEQLDAARHEAKEKVARLFQLESVVEKMEEAREKHGRVFEELKSSQQSVATLEHQLKNCRQQLGAAQMEQKDLEREGDDLQREVITLTTEHEQQLQLVRDDLARQIGVLQTDCHSLKADLWKLRLELVSSQQGVASMEEQLRRSQQQYEVAEVELGDLRKDGDDLHRQLANVNTAASGKRSEHEQQVRRMRDNLMEHMSENQALKFELECNAASACLVRNECDHAKEELNQMHQRNTRLVETHAQQTTKMAAEMKELHDLFSASLELSTLVQYTLAQGEKRTHMVPLARALEHATSLAQFSAAPAETSKPFQWPEHKTPQNHVIFTEHLSGGGSRDSVSDDVAVGLSGAESGDEDDKHLTDQKQAQSMDSGLASNITELLHSRGTTLVSTPSIGQYLVPPGATPLSFMYLDETQETTTFEHHNHSLLDTPKADATTNNGAEQHSPTCSPDDLSIFPLDTTVTQAQVSMFDLESSGFDLSSTALDAADANQYQELAISSSLDPQSIRFSLFRFHGSVRQLARNYTSTLAEVMRLQDEGARLRDKEEELRRALSLLEQMKVELAVKTERTKSLEAAAIVSSELAKETENLVKHFRSMEEEKASLENKVLEWRAVCEVRATELEGVWQELQQEKAIIVEKESLIAEQKEKGRVLEEVQVEVRRLQEEVVERREEEGQQRREVERLEREVKMLAAEMEHKEEVNIALEDKVKEHVLSLETGEICRTSLGQQITSLQRDLDAAQTKWMNKCRDIQATCQRQMASMGEEHAQEIHAEVSRIKEEHERELKVMSSDYSCKFELERNRLTVELQCFHQQQLRSRESELFKQLREERVRLASRLTELEETHQQEIKTITAEHARKLKEDREHAEMELGTTHQAEKMVTEGVTNAPRMRELEVSHHRDVPGQLEQVHLMDQTSHQQQVERTLAENALTFEAERAAHQQEVKEINAQQAQKLSELDLIHAEALHEKIVEVEARMMGEVAALKLQHEEEQLRLQQQCNNEIRNLSEGHKILQSLRNAGSVGESWLDLDEEETALLHKIVELGPSLVSTSGEVRDLVRSINNVPRTSAPNMSVPPAPIAHLPCAPADGASIDSLLDHFKRLLLDIRAAKGDYDVRDWRKELLEAVEKILEQERKILSSAISFPDIPNTRERGGESDVGDGARDEDSGSSSSSVSYQMLLDQLCRQSGLIEELPTVERNSLVKEIGQLREANGKAKEEHERREQEWRSQAEHARHTADSSLLHQLHLEKSRSCELEKKVSSLHGDLTGKNAQLLEVDTENRQLREVSKERDRLQRQFDSVQSAVEQSVNKASDAIDCLQKELLSSQTQVSKLQNSTSLSQACVVELKSQLAQQSGQCQAASAEVEQARTALTLSREELAEAQRAKGALQMHNTHLQSELSSRTGHMASELKLLEGCLGKEKELAARLRSELALATDEHRQELQSSQTQVSKLQNSLSLSQACVVELKCQLAQQSGQCQAASAEVEQARTALTLSREELAEAQRAKGVLQMHNTQLQSELSSKCCRMASELKMLERQLGNEKELTATLRCELALATDEHRQELQSSQTQVSVLHNSLSLSQACVVELKCQLAQQSGQCQAASAEVEQARTALTVSREEKAEAQRAKGALQMHNTHLQSELSSRSSNNGRMESELKQLEGQLGKEKVLTARLRAEIALVADEHVQELQSSQTQVSVLQNSLSLNRACVVELKCQLAQQSGQCQAASAEVEQARTALTLSREELAEAQRAKGALQMHNTHLQSELSSRSNKTGRMESELKLLEGCLGKEKELTARLRSELALITDEHVQDNLASSEKINSLHGELHRTQAEVNCLTQQLPAKARADVAQREIHDLKLRHQNLQIKLKMAREELAHSEQSQISIVQEKEKLKMESKRWEERANSYSSKLRQSEGLEQELAEARALLQCLGGKCGLETSKVLRLYAQYRQAEVHRKSLVFQKTYLECHLDAFYQTQQVALKLMADMGAPIRNRPPTYPPPSKYPRPYARFRAVGAVVLATFRFRYMIRRKSQYLQSKMAKLVPAVSRAAIFKNGSICVKTSRDVPRLIVNTRTSCGSETSYEPPRPLTQGGHSFVPGVDTDLGGSGSNYLLSRCTTDPQTHSGISKFVTSPSYPVLSSDTDTHYLQYSNSRLLEPKMCGSKTPHRKTKKELKTSVHLGKTQSSRAPLRQC